MSFFDKKTAVSDLIITPVSAVGSVILSYVEKMGEAGVFLFHTAGGVLQCGCRFINLLKQLMFLGVKSSFIIVLTGLFTGMVLALQGFYALNKFGATSLLGTTVALTLIRELGPVLTALMIAARAGSALTAEMGTMRVTEQIDALEVMGIDPYSYLVFPNMAAGLIAFPILTFFFDVVGIWGGWLVATRILGLSTGSYFGEMSSYVEMRDITNGIVKALVFAVIVLWICLYIGFYTRGGAKGVSRATTRAVVLSAVNIFMWDYVLTSMLGY